MGTEDAERASSFAARFGYATDSKGEAARTYRVAVYPGWLSHVDMPVIDKTYVSSEFGDFKPIYRAGTTIGGVKCLVEKNEETNSLGTRVAYEFVPKKE
jgi:hypothetical protein